jgi:L-ascorbate metabolism protein UlaG (beta-lactamase superfamily)
MVLDQDGEQLIIDPGSFTPKLPELGNVVGVIVTHEHSDHLSSKNLDTILQANPDAPLYAPQDVLDQLTELNGKKEVAKSGESAQLGSFSIKFIGGDHATIYKKSPCKNVGVLVNETFYYPGDSLDKPAESVDTLAVPASAPWMKTSEAMDFIAEIKPKKVFPAHDMLLSDIGKMVSYRWLEKASKEAGAEWLVLEDGQSI